jgi:hypothetical protein
MHWLYPANTKYYDVLGAFSYNHTFWPMKSRVSVDDTLYIYLAAPYKQIAFECEISKIGLEQSTVWSKIEPFFKQLPDGDGNEKPFMKLDNIKALSLNKDSGLQLGDLRGHGLTGMLMGPRNLDKCPELLTYIQSVPAK